MTVDWSHLWVLARGSHRTGYTGVVVYRLGGVVTEADCGHRRHLRTAEARECVRRAIMAAMSAREVPG